MQQTPKSLRLHIGIFGRTNVGKSSFLNMVAGQDVAITSPVPGTTTDVVEKPMELLPVGPVVFLDTAGLDDVSLLAQRRLERTQKAMDRSDVAIVVTEPGIWKDFEINIVAGLKAKNKPFIVVVNKADGGNIEADFQKVLEGVTADVLVCSSVIPASRNACVHELKRLLIKVCPEELMRPLLLVGDLVAPGGVVVLVIPIDKEAPKGRVILPQVQVLRDALDHDIASLIVKENDLAQDIARLKVPPDLVVCDSQVVDKMVAHTPENIACTTFSILLARFKGDLDELSRGAAHIASLKPGDKVLIAESCSHHAIEDDIGRVKLPRWLSRYVGGDLQVSHCAGRDYPANLKDYKLIIHCGSCMLTRGEMLFRIHQAKENGIPITNYGLAISFVQGVLKRVLSPFPSALEAFEVASRQGTSPKRLF
jgi:[FeFe] hydrogenase H-cluster maturation GTPase HydF